MEGKNIKRARDIVAAYSGTSAEAWAARLDGLAPEFGQGVLDWCFGDVYGRPGLDHKTRELLIISALAAMGNAQQQLENHVRWATRAGATRTEILETLVQITPYAGLPAAIRALEGANRVLAEIEGKPAEIEGKPKA